MKIIWGFRSIRCISKFANQSFRFLSWFDTILPLRKQFINLLFQSWTKKTRTKEVWNEVFLYWKNLFAVAIEKKMMCNRQFVILITDTYKNTEFFRSEWIHWIITVRCNKPIYHVMQSGNKASSSNFIIFHELHNHLRF